MLSILFYILFLAKSRGTNLDCPPPIILSYNSHLPDEAVIKKKIAWNHFEQL